MNLRKFEYNRGYRYYYRMQLLDNKYELKYSWSNISQSSTEIDYRVNANTQINVTQFIFELRINWNTTQIII